MEPRKESTYHLWTSENNSPSIFFQFLPSFEFYVVKYVSINFQHVWWHTFTYPSTKFRTTNLFKFRERSRCQPAFLQLWAALKLIFSSFRVKLCIQYLDISKYLIFDQVRQNNWGVLGCNMFALVKPTWESIGRSVSRTRKKIVFSFFKGSSTNNLSNFRNYMFIRWAES